MDLQADVQENADNNKLMNLPFKEFEKYIQTAKNSYDHIESINNYDKALEIKPEYDNALKEKYKVLDILKKISKFENEEQSEDSW